jgi:phosphoribosyl 1,2-cyclic phosphodiesterase
MGLQHRMTGIGSITFAACATEKTVKICLLASGSKGNAIYVEAGDSRLLIDAGLSATEIIKRLSLIGVAASSINGILISHDHSDHTRGVGTLARKLKIPVLVSYRTREAVEKLLHKCEVTEFESEYPFTFRDITIDPFQTTHDAVDPLGFVIESSEGRYGHATDFGIVTRLVTEKLKKCRAIVIEANHDEEMLMNGPYPWHLKQRIKSRHGHISNAESMGLLESLLHEGLEGVFLAHLSEVNNDPELPRSAAEKLLQNQTLCNPDLFIGNQYHPGKLFTI